MPGIDWACPVASTASRHSGNQRRLERHVDAHRDGAAAQTPALLVAGRWHVLRGTGVPGYLPASAPALVVALASAEEAIDASDADLLWVIADE
ncbi:hypothetical protein ACODUO_14725 [Stenotrophomonas maltophilia]